MAWTVVNFGKYRDKGKSLPQILFDDPDWFFWAYSEGVFNNKGGLQQEADDLYQKATTINIPDNDDNDLIVEYYIHQPTGKFSHFDIVPSDRSPHEGGSPSFRSKVIDMSVPRKIASYDKLGCKELIKSLKRHVFGNSNTRISKKKCESFFSDPNNFYS